MKREWSPIALGALSAAGYAVALRLAGESGFPLDDAWIHQTYARNLGWHGQWAFILGQPSAGSTSPLWTAMLAIGYTLRIDYELWAMALNALLLGATAWLMYRVSGQWWAGALAAVEWHLVWAAASGMETILFCALAMGAWALTPGPSPKRRGEFLCGVLIGLAVWARPDGLTLLPFCAWAVWAAAADGTLRLKRLGGLAGGAAFILIPYFIFNVALSGQVWPNTFFAKQAEYAILRELPLWQRVWQIFSAPLIGSLALLAPGVALGARGRWPQLAWVGAFLAAYALRLPVTYQHGRYLIPVIPMLIAIGGAGLAKWARWNVSVMWRRVVSRAWVMSVGAAAAAFWGLGANALVSDVRVINNEMVAVAKWIASHAGSDTLVAAHDIGALGYFADVRLMDLAGLVSPEMIPLMGDDSRLWDFIREGKPTYVITYPGWCPEFTRQPDLKPQFQTGALCDPANPNLNMTVYLLERH
ncbi:MAG: hypothetical protein FJ030_00780 [Chloroflexi bacterium]|nr:hypothetical protein [Chloroflexota bacterium]